jgi:hypothetical protein
MGLTTRSSPQPLRRDIPPTEARASVDRTQRTNRGAIASSCDARRGWLEPVFLHLLYLGAAVAERTLNHEVY